MSISRAQAQALADGFINSIGSGSQSDLQPRETFTEIILIAGELAEDTQKNLKKAGSVSSGDLSSSIETNEPVLKGSILEIDIFMNRYGLFVNKGVKGTKSGHSKAGYKFTKSGPSKAFVESIQAWIKRGGLKSTNVKRSVSKHESKNKSIAEISSAYAVSRSIMQKGIKGNGFFDKAAKTAVKKVGSRLGAALKIDVITSISRA